MKISTLAWTAIGLVVASATAIAQTAPTRPADMAGSAATSPPLPAMTSDQADRLEREMASYRRDVDARVAQGTLRADEAATLLSWRRWQIARQITAGALPDAPAVAPPAYARPPQYAGPPSYAPLPSYAPPPSYAAPPEYAPPPPPAYVYEPYWRPYSYSEPYRVWIPRPSICLGGWGRHAFGSLCF